MKPSHYQAARNGGRNSGLYERFKHSRLAEIEKSIRSYERQIAEHEEKIRNPDPYLRPNCSRIHRDDLIDRYWPEEISDFREKIDVMRGIIAERTNGNS